MDLVAKLLPLYRTAQEASIAEFDRALFRCVADIIPLSSAIFCDAQVGERQFTFYSMRAYEEPETVVDELPRLNRRYDTVIQRVSSRPRRACAFPQERLYPHPDQRQMLDYIRRYGHANVMAIADFAHPRARGTWMSLYRSRPDHCFTGEDEQLLTLIMPHITQAQEINQEINGIPVQLGAGAASALRALVSAQGRLIACGSGFTRLMRQRWPDWCSARLPAELLAELQSGRESVRVPGSAVTVSRHAFGAYWLLEARSHRLASTLSARELQIGRLFSEGLRYKSIAKALDLSPATVRNVVPRIYRKLGIDNKVALSEVVRAEYSSCSVNGTIRSASSGA